MRTTSCCGLCLGANDANIVAGIDLKIRQTLYARVQDSFQAEMQPFFDSCIFSGEERGVGSLLSEPEETTNFPRRIGDYLVSYALHMRGRLQSR